MDAMQKAAFLGMVQRACAEDPSLLRPLIDAATEGVKEFADKQSDAASKMAFKLFSVLDDVPVKDTFGPFSKDEVLEPLSRWFEGTPGLENLRKKFGVEE